MGQIRLDSNFKKILAFSSSPNSEVKGSSWSEGWAGLVPCCPARRWWPPVARTPLRRPGCSWPCPTMPPHQEPPSFCPWEGQSPQVDTALVSTAEHMCVFLFWGGKRQVRPKDPEAAVRMPVKAVIIHGLWYLKWFSFCCKFGKWPQSMVRPCLSLAGTHWTPRPGGWETPLVVGGRGRFSVPVWRESSRHQYTLLVDWSLPKLVSFVSEMIYMAYVIIVPWIPCHEVLTWSILFPFACVIWCFLKFLAFVNCFVEVYLLGTEH